MGFFDKLKNIFTTKKKENKPKDIEITDRDILYALNYNIIIRKRFYSNTLDNTIFEEYKSFKYLEEMKLFYDINDEYLIFYIDKYEKFKQLINNIIIYLELSNGNKLMYDCRNYSLYANIFELIAKERKNTKEFDFIKFFSRFEWVRNCENYRDVSIKIDLCDNNDIEIRYKIIEKNDRYILGSFRDELIKIDFLEKKIYFGLKIIDEV
ncbi:hypothetical protein DW663_12335 [Fusobacterium mortiferum]|uniref:Uncharacterized protein n=1 Tax=Fusobacterium mortiferum TaxID=850 RepID=A0A414PMQ3_FUSMR|nr:MULTISPECIES: hypothetical protein [Fusobacterium]MCI6382283.1 hypothetical protein [Fusobacterium mortiferum]RGN00621.1 hypothetical protein DXB84_01690 [Fusobacterium mortiferum]RHF69727.1 hypothetical protein DW663_12335 [Fusobacterium mortiferum]